MFTSNAPNKSKMGGKCNSNTNDSLHQVRTVNSKSTLITPNFVPTKPKVRPHVRDVATTTDGLATARIDMSMVRMEKIFHETMHLDANLQQDMLKLEKVYERKYNEVYDKRMKLLAEIKKIASSSACPLAGAIGNFWLEVIKSVNCMPINSNDEKILTHLIDVRSKWNFDTIPKFILQFFFEPNDFFSNSVLTKTYFLNCIPDEEDPVSFDGPEIFKCEGCEIEWKSLRLISVDAKPASFFDFFSPPMLPVDAEHPNFDKINAILEKDFEWGFYFKDKVIPKALKFFTGEIENKLPETATASNSNNEEPIESDTDN